MTKTHVTLRLSSVGGLCHPEPLPSCENQRENRRLVQNQGPLSRYQLWFGFSTFFVTYLFFPTKWPPPAFPGNILKLRFSNFQTSKFGPKKVELLCARC